MSRLIDVEALPTSIENMDLEVAEKIVERWMQDAPCDISWDAVRVLRDFYDEVKDAQTIDAVPVIRCKDCKHYYFAENRVPEEQSWVCDVWHVNQTAHMGYCFKAERRSDDSV